MSKEKQTNQEVHFVNDNKIVTKNIYLFIAATFFLTPWSILFEWV